jgi:DNA-binding NarL/FixJ family response regulator
MTGAPRILVADDHPALLAAVCAFLEESGFDVVGQAADGGTAVALARDVRPDAVVLDYRMPRLRGSELVGELRAEVDTAVAVYTADADERLVAEAFAAGAAAVILKEAPLADVTRALSAILAGGTYVDPALGVLTLTGAGSRLELTQREADVLLLLADGHTYEAIGRRLEISPETVRTHLQKASERLNASTRTHAVATAIRLGLI